MTRANRLENARAEALLGDDSLRSAEALLGLGLHNDSVSRAYYAAFHYARALLLLLGLEPKTHRGVLALLSEHYEKPGLISPDFVSSLAQLQAFRNLADYDAASRIQAERAHGEVNASRAFVAAARALLTAG
jgi:uncharacterized protein (UPF0332 family)